MDTSRIDFNAISISKGLFIKLLLSLLHNASSTLKILTPLLLSSFIGKLCLSSYANRLILLGSLVRDDDTPFFIITVNCFGMEFFSVWSIKESWGFKQYPFFPNLSLKYFEKNNHAFMYQTVVSPDCVLGFCIQYQPLIIGKR